MEGFMAKPLIWLIGRTMKVRKRKNSQAVSTKTALPMTLQSWK
jgi:hypothetical protein